MANLRAQLLQLASIPREEADRRMLREAIFVAVGMVITHIHALGTSYDLGVGVTAVEKELNDDGSRAAAKQPAIDEPPVTAVDDMDVPL